MIKSDINLQQFLGIDEESVAKAKKEEDRLQREMFLASMNRKQRRAYLSRERKAQNR